VTEPAFYVSTVSLFGLFAILFLIVGCVRANRTVRWKQEEFRRTIQLLRGTSRVPGDRDDRAADRSPGADDATSGGIVEEVDA